VITVFSALDALPAGCDALFAAAGRSFYCTRDWFSVSIAHALPAGTAPCLALYAEAGQPLALFPLQMEAGQMEGGKSLKSLTNPYTCLYQPLFHPAADAAAIRRAGQAFGRFCRGWSTTRLDGLDADLAGLPPLLTGMRDAGLLLERFDHFGNWHEAVTGWSWRDYLDARPGALRETIRRKLRRAERDADTVFELIATPDRIEAGIAAYDHVYAQSWKVPEPFPRFNPELMRLAAAQGALRLGVLRHQGRPVAVQYWIVWQGHAAVLKLAHDETDKAASPGTVLTALIIRHLLDEEHVRELDFGRGDDPYKRLWVGQRRQRIGVVLINPRRIGGLRYLGRLLLGRGRRFLRRLPHLVSALPKRPDLTGKTVQFLGGNPEPA
jgi:CelD/BcsL family acetyltransferase involved in cellulose biosynthesis